MSGTTKQPDFDWLELIVDSRLITGEGGAIEISPEHRHSVAIFDNGVALVAKGRREEMAIRYAIDRARKTTYAVHYFVEVEYEVLAAFLAGVSHGFERAAGDHAPTAQAGGGDDLTRMKERLQAYETWAREIGRSIVSSTESATESLRQADKTQKTLIELASRFGAAPGSGSRPGSR